MEALLTDNERGEITHKLSLRLSELIALFRPDYNPLNTFSSIKDLYIPVKNSAKQSQLPGLMKLRLPLIISDSSFRYC